MILSGLCKELHMKIVHKMCLEAKISLFFQLFWRCSSAGARHATPPSTSAGPPFPYAFPTLLHS